MNIFVTLDYELFFGANTGTVDNCMILPTNELVKVADKYGVKLIFFVDIGFILKLEQLKTKHEELERDYRNILSQIRKLKNEGHDFQLHIHPHWEDSCYDGKRWHIDASRYRLHTFNKTEIEDIVSRYKTALSDIVGDTIFAYRAGGWCIQPFEMINEALNKNGIWLDCTVFKGGFNHSPTHYYDFRSTPDKTMWKFEKDPLIECANGFFTEIPISSYKVSPLFYWKLAFARLSRKKKYTTFGDGQAVNVSRSYLYRLFFSKTCSTVSLDGLKPSFLQKAFVAHKNKYKVGYFTIIGHPKGVTPYGLNKLDCFFNVNKEICTVSTYSEIFGSK